MGLPSPFPISPAVSTNITGPLNGVAPPKYRTGEFIFPHYAQSSATGVTTTATRKYQTKIWLPGNQSFSGIRFNNTGAGDNGEKFTAALYNESASGGAGTLVVNFGEVTLTAAAAVRTLSSSFTTAYSGWYYLHNQYDSASAMSGMESATTYSSAGIVSPQPTNAMLGSADIIFGTLTGLYAPFQSVDLTYVSTPPATASSFAGAASVTYCPAFNLIV